MILHNTHLMSTYDRLKNLLCHLTSYALTGLGFAADSDAVPRRAAPRRPGPVTRVGVRVTGSVFQVQVAGLQLHVYSETLCLPAPVNPASGTGSLAFAGRGRSELEP